MPRFCKNGGCTVNASFPLPADLRDFLHPALNDVLGCNRLQCLRCGKSVRQEPGRGCGGMLIGAAPLYEAPNWNTLPSAPGSRVYACACHVWEESGWHAMADPDHDPVSDPEFPWRCSGHPDAGLPWSLDGVRIEDADAVRAVVGRAMDGQAPEGAVPDHRGVPAMWVCRLYGALEGLPEAGCIVEVVESCLSSADPFRVGAALMFHTRFPRVESFKGVLELAERDECRGAGRVYPCLNGRSRPFEMTPARVLAVRLASVHQGPDARDVQAASILRRFLTTPASGLVPGATEAMGELAARDPAWFVANAPRIAEATPQAWDAVLGALIV